jgi:hypothetical protein
MKTATSRIGRGYEREALAVYRLVLSVVCAITWLSSPVWTAPNSPVVALATKTEINGESVKNDWPSTSTSLYRAGIFTSEGKDEASSQILRAILGTSDPGLEKRARELLMFNERSHYHYREALGAIAPLLKRGEDRDLINKARLLEALIDVPPEKIDSGAGLELHDLHLVAAVGRSRFDAVLDTGATWSLISRSAARQAGLPIRPLGYRIATSLGQRENADLAVGDVWLERIHIRNAVFLVPSHSAFGGASSPSVLIGIPILRRLAVSIGEARGVSAGADIRFVEGVPVVQTSFSGVRLQCELDTGADRTSFATARLPVRAFGRATRVERRISVTSAAGRFAGIPAYEIAATIGIADREVMVPHALVIAAAGKTLSRECSLGRDALLRLAPLTLDFRSMRILVH